MKSIRVVDLCFDREDFRLGPLSFELERGSRTALVGPSGAGKSTLLRCLAGLETAVSGEVWFDRSNMAGVPPRARDIGFVFQSGALWPHMTALQHLRFVAPELTRDEALSQLQDVGLTGSVTSRRPSGLSGGEQQRLALARALAPRPSVLLLDEPLGSLDTHLRAELALLVRTLSAEAGLTLLVVTHDRDEALAMADELIVMHAGRVIELGPALDLLQNPASSFTAAFLRRAACLAAEPDNAGTLRTSFGAQPRPGGKGPWSLVLLPGDVAPSSGKGPEVRVLHCEPDLRGFRVHASLEGRILEFLVEAPIAAGSSVRVELVGAPRILPEVPVELT